MYDRLAVTQAVVEAPPPIEPVSAVHQNTLSVLTDATNSLSQLLTKVRGSQPERTIGEDAVAKTPERHLLGDARTVRELAARIYEQANELHRYIGHEKS